MFSVAPSQPQVQGTPRRRHSWRPTRSGLAAAAGSLFRPREERLMEQLNTPRTPRAQLTPHAPLMPRKTQATPRAGGRLLPLADAQGSVDLDSNGMMRSVSTRASSHSPVSTTGSANDPGVVPSPPAPVGTRRRRKTLDYSAVRLPDAVEARKNVAKNSQQDNYEQDIEIQQLFSSWLGWAPRVDSPCARSLYSKFPGALPASVVLNRVKSVLFPRGFSAKNTLYGQSICSDEINNEKGGLPDQLRELWGSVFPLGGIGGAPYAGKTGFGAFVAHVPVGGNIFILYGPHVGVAEDGTVGKYLRQGQESHSTACGALIAAYNQCCSGQQDEDECDMQQDWIRAQVAPYAHEISEQKDPMAALAIRGFEMVHAKVMTVMSSNFGTGKLVLLGGIQINTPSGMQDHFVPYAFTSRTADCHVEDYLHEAFESSTLTNKTLAPVSSQRRNSAAGFKSVLETTPQLLPASRQYAMESKQDELSGTTIAHSHFFSWLGWAPPVNSPCERALNMNFPAALPASVVLERASQRLFALGMGIDNTLFGQSICPDEINNEKGGLSDQMRNTWGGVFPLGGIGAAPFVGQTGFGAFSAHVPDNGNIFILYGPHVGVAESGEVGKYLRRGQSKSSTACGALIAAYNSCCQGQHSDQESPLDMQQNWLRQQMLPCTASISGSKVPMTTLALHAFEIVQKKLLSIVNTNFGSGNLVLLGGVLINMPEGYQDHFLPLDFTMYAEGKAPVDMLCSFDYSDMIRTCDDWLAQHQDGTR